MAFSNLGVAVECGSFRGFENFSERIIRYFSGLLDVFREREQTYFVREFRFNIIDRFNYPVGFDISAYNAREIFSESTRYLSANILDSGVLWHSFQGWFEPSFDSPRRRLNQLNIQNVQVNPVAVEIATVIEYNLFWQMLGDPLNANELIGEGENCIRNFVARSYDANKNILKDLLNSNKLQEIGIV
nr:hypothetical protein [Delftia acidovorans]